MALTKDKKKQIVSEVASLLESSKMTVIVRYQGTGVKALQELRQLAADKGTTVMVVKNRLVIKAIQHSPRFKESSMPNLEGMLLYAFNGEDELAPAQAVAQMARTSPSLQFVGALSDDGSFINADDVNELANLPSKEQLRSLLVYTFAAPLSNFVNSMVGNSRNMLTVLMARAETLSE